MPSSASSDPSTTRSTWPGWRALGGVRVDNIKPQVNRFFPDGLGRLLPEGRKTAIDVTNVETRSEALQWVCHRGPTSEDTHQRRAVPRGQKWCLFNTIFGCYVGLNSCPKSRAPLCDAADRPVCLASTSEPDMFLGVALVCPAFLNLLEQIGTQNCVCRDQCRQ